MKFRKILLVFLFIVIVLITHEVQAETPEITATSGAVIDCIDGKILYEKNADEKLYPASLTKVLTAILLVENCNMEDEIVVHQSAIDNVEYGYLTANIKADEVLTAEQLLNLLMVSSCNDVANVIAEHIGGDISEFVVMMNEKAKQIGCTNSNFVNCNGTHDVDHYSTAHDMALIGKYAMQYSVIKDAMSKTEYVLGITNKYDMEDRVYYTNNEMLLSGSANYYKYAQGVKTGFTTPSGYCLMTYIEKNELPLITVVMKSTTSDSRYDDSRAIINYTYDNNMVRTIAEEGAVIQTINVKNATKATKKLNATVAHNVIAVVNKENESAGIEPKIEINEKLKAPIEKGSVIGKVSYQIEGRTYTADLIAGDSVVKSNKVLIFIFVFIGIMLVIGGLRILGLRKRNAVLKKIRKK